MFGRTTSVLGTQISTSNFTPSSNIIGVVYHVFLSETDSILDDLEIEEELRTEYIGAVQFRLYDAHNKSEDNLSIAFPKNTSLNKLPVKNELITITNSPGGFYYEIIRKSVTPNVSSTDDTTTTTFSVSKSNSDSVNTYKNVSKTGITRNNSNESSKLNGYGKYFETEKIHKLQLHEGDTLIESRFGQSIRFSGYNNDNNIFSPTVIIRNGESGITSQKEITEGVLEDINRDGSVILLGSDEFIADFKPGTVDDGGNSDFETNPNTFKSYPSILKGDQILLNSGRIILSAKTDEMIFYSKKNYGFISDGSLSIDNKFGIDVSVGDNININTNNRDVNVNSGNGKINLGNQNLEPLVRGETLVRLLTELITAIEVMTHATPAGPSSPPINIASFTKIKGQLRTILSNLNKTS